MAIEPMREPPRGRWKSCLFELALFALSAVIAYRIARHFFPELLP